MGWSSVQSKRRGSAVAMLEEYTPYYEGNVWFNSTEQGVKVRKVEVKEMAKGPGGVYGIVAITDILSGQVYNTALVVLVQRKGDEFSWKTMTESSGPVVCGMPVRLLKMLTPAHEFAFGKEREYIEDWRERVKQLHENKKRVINVGDILEFVSPFRFRSKPDSVQVHRFKVLSWGRSKLFAALCDDGSTFRCTLTRRALQVDFTVHA
jgi:hypothetical protein